MANPIRNSNFKCRLGRSYKKSQTQTQGPDGFPDDFQSPDAMDTGTAKNYKDFTAIGPSHFLSCALTFCSN